MERYILVVIRDGDCWSDFYLHLLVILQDQSLLDEEDEKEPVGMCLCSPACLVHVICSRVFIVRVHHVCVVFMRVMVVVRVFTVCVPMRVTCVHGVCAHACHVPMERNMWSW